MDAYDLLQQAGERCAGALRAPSGSARLIASREAAEALAASIAAQERAILIRWQALGRDEIVVRDVVHTVYEGVELARDMAALRWTHGLDPYNLYYRRPSQPLGALSRADWAGVAKAVDALEAEAGKGMTKLDTFAAAALQGLLAGGFQQSSLSIEEIVKLAFDYAEICHRISDGE